MPLTFNPKSSQMRMIAVAPASTIIFPGSEKAPTTALSCPGVRA